MGDDDEFSNEESDQSDSEESEEEVPKKKKATPQVEKYVPPGKRAVLKKAEDEKAKKRVSFNEEMNEDRSFDEDEDQEGDEFDEEMDDEEFSDEESSSGSADDFDGEEERVKAKSKKGSKSKAEDLKADIYGRLVDKQGKVVKSEKYVPPGQRLKNLLEKSAAENGSRKLINLSKQLNGLLNRLSTSNMHSISNQIIQMFYSNQYTRYDLIEALFNLFNSSLIQKANVSPIRLIVEHAALASILSANIGVELGANFLQKFSTILNKELTSSDERSFSIENKTLDNLVLFLCNLYNFKLFSSSLLSDLLSEHLIELLKVEQLATSQALVIHFFKIN